MKKTALLLSLTLLFSSVMGMVPCNMAYALEAGVATIEITPPVGVKLWGYQLRKDPSTGVLDPLYAKAVVFDDGETRAALVSLDLGRTPPDEYISRIRNMVKEKFQIEQTLLAATHTHSGPYFGFSDLPDEWIDEMCGRITEVIGQAKEKTEPVKLFTGTGSIDLTYDRRVVNPDKSITMMWDNYERKPTTPVDQDIRILQIRNESDHVIATLVHYACHPVLSGPQNLLISADFPVSLYSHVERELGGTCIYLQGACGNINPYMAAILSRDPEKGYEEIKKEGEKLGREVVRISRELKPVVAENFSIHTHSSCTPLKLRYPLEDRRIQDVLDGLYSREWIEEFSKADKHELTAETSIVTLGDAVAWVGFPGEFWDDFQKDLRQRSPIPQTYFVGYCNGYLSYFPTIQAAAEGGYGADYGLLTEPGAGERLLDQTIIDLYRILGVFD
ncbi:MAG: neutral/alkaline non-lysosomal ceramidase N-terminal domain-containing protein [bacterium]|jgi:neutral ceramidase